MRFRRHQEAAENATWGMLAGFALALLLLVVAVNVALALAVRLTLPFLHGYPPLFFETNTAVVLLFVLGGCWIETLRLREGGPHVARLAGARGASRGARPPILRSTPPMPSTVRAYCTADASAPNSRWRATAACRMRPANQPSEPTATSAKPTSAPA